jgi:hypothetical protein
MSEDESEPPVEAGSGNYELSRFNAARHGVLSKSTVLPWEEEHEYRELLGALTAEHSPEGQTERYLLEELAGIIWRKQRLRSAETALHHYSLKRAIEEFLAGGEATLRGVTHNHPDPLPALSASSPEETDRYLADIEAYRAQTVKAMGLLKPSSSKSYEVGLAALHGHTREWWSEYRAWMESHQRPGVVSYAYKESSFMVDAVSLRDFLETKILPWCARGRQVTDDRAMIDARAFSLAISHDRLEKFARYEVALDRKFERTLAMLLKFQDLRRASRLS